MKKISFALMFLFAFCVAFVPAAMAGTIASSNAVTQSGAVAEIGKVQSSVDINSKGSPILPQPITPGFAPAYNQFIPAEDARYIVDPDMLMEWWRLHVKFTTQEGKTVYLVPGEMNNYNDLLSEIGGISTTGIPLEPEIVRGDACASTIDLFYQVGNKAAKKEATVVMVFARVKATEIKGTTNSGSANVGLSLLRGFTGWIFDIGGSQTKGTTTAVAVEAIQAIPYKLQLTQSQFDQLEKKVSSWILSQQRARGKMQEKTGRVASLEVDLKIAEMENRLNELKKGTVSSPVLSVKPEQKKSVEISPAIKAKGAGVINGK